ncbi:MAG: hypothetical protein K6G58_04625 [Lachnospiraceae bacterium]|nr:hypothetical protein [Lachnospiraceae bacterium]
MMRKHRKLISDLAGLAVFLIGLFVVFFYIFKRCRSEYNADFTDTILWADAAVRSGHYYNPDYWYAYFLPFSGIPIMIPIVAVFGLTYFSHQLGMAVFAVIFGAALFIYAKSCGHTYGESFALSGITMILMCASTVTRMIFYGHIIHYSLAIVFMCIAYCLLKKSSLYRADAVHGKLYTILLALWCMLCCTNGMATFILFFFPFSLSLFLERYFDKREITKDDIPLLKRFSLLIAGGIAGFGLKLILFGNQEYEDSITALLPSKEWVWNTRPFLLEWIKNLTGPTDSDVIMMMSFDGIRILIMYTLAIVILIVPIFAAFYYKKIEDRMLRLLILFHLSMFAMTLYTYSVSYAVVQTWRLSALVCSAVIVTLTYTIYMIKSQKLMRWYVLMVPVIAVCVLMSALTVKHIPSAMGTNQNDDLIGIFREHGLSRGYSFFWNSANAAMVLSDNEITVSPIEIYPDGSYEVKRYQSEASGYEDVPGTDRYFVVVDSQDMRYLEDTLAPHKIEEIKYQDDLYIWVFDHNIFHDLEPVYKPQ